MKLGIMQPYLFPYIGYFQLMNAVDKFILLDTVTFIKGGWINRNRILLQDKPHMFNFSLSNAGSNVLIKDIKLNNKARDASKLLKTIDNNYKKAPYYNTAREIVSRICEYDCEFISGFVRNSIEQINSYLGINTALVSTSIDYNNELTGQERIIEICRYENAICYINSLGGIELYNENVFAENGIILKFLKTHEDKYQQLTGGFVPWLSIIDVMMFNSVEQIQKMLLKFDLVHGCHNTERTKTYE